VSQTAFEAHRDHLMAVAYRMLGSRADAEDAVQEAWLRWHRASERSSAASDAAGVSASERSSEASDAAGVSASERSSEASDAAGVSADQAEIRELRAWLTTVTARICLDQLRSARVRREAYVGQWLPEPVVERLPSGDGDPAEWVARADEVSYALLVVLERLSPEQRVAFVLHDVFAVPFDEIAAVLSTTSAAARQLATRARRAVHADGAPRHTADLAEQRRVVAAFLDAAESGDIDGLLAVLAPDVVTVGDGAGGAAPAARRPVVGALAVARFFAGLYRRYGKEAERIHLELVRLNGALGMLSEIHLPDGTVFRGVTAFAIADGRLTGIFNQLNPAKLTRVPAPDPTRALPPPTTDGDPR
jgi:RNA polymerase sigma-70 factor (ECF subfamily)